MKLINWFELYCALKLYYKTLVTILHQQQRLVRCQYRLNQSDQITTYFDWHGRHDHRCRNLARFAESLKSLHTETKDLFFTPSSPSKKTITLNLVVFPTTLNWGMTHCLPSNNSFLELRNECTYCKKKSPLYINILNTLFV